MPPPPSGPSRIWRELKRRKVFRVAAVYGATAFVVLQVTALVVEPLGLPPWVQTLVVVLAAAGFPIALVLAWAFEVTPDGVRRERDGARTVRDDAGPAGHSDTSPSSRPSATDVDPAEGAPAGAADARRARELAAVFAGGVLVALVGVGAYAYLGDGSDGGPGAAVEGPAGGTADGPDGPGRAPAGAAGRAAADGAAAEDDRGGDPGRRPTARRQLSVAVLPFADMSDQADQTFLADGVTEDILTRLAQIRNLRVISRTSVMQYRDSERTVPQIAEELGVSHVLEGSVQRAGDRVRITAQLIDARSDRHLWAESYDRTLEDIFAVQGEIAGEIAGALQVRLGADLRSRLDRAATGSPLAYELYLRGREYFYDHYRGPGELNDLRVSAAALFRQALAEDSAFAPAWAGLARAYRERIDLDRDVRYDSAVAFARRATRLDPALADGYVQLARAYALRGQDEAALEQARYALELNPSHAGALMTLGRHLASRGDLAGAVRLLRRAARVDPAVYPPYAQLAAAWATLGRPDRAERLVRRAFGEGSPAEPRMHCGLAFMDLARDDTAAALAHRDRFLELEPEAPYAKACAAGVSLSVGRHEAAGKWLEDVVASPPMDAGPRIDLAYVRAAAGDTAGARRLLDEAEALTRREMEEGGTDPGDLADMAQIRALRGDAEGALEALRTAVDAGWRNPLSLHLDGAWDDLRDDPRFRALVQEVEEDLERQRRELEEEGGALEL